MMLCSIHEKNAMITELNDVGHHKADISLSLSLSLSLSYIYIYLVCLLRYHSAEQDSIDIRGVGRSFMLYITTMLY